MITILIIIIIIIIIIAIKIIINSTLQPVDFFTGSTTDRSSKINIKVPTKQAAQIIQNFILILTEWKLENERFQSNRNKKEKQAMEIVFI